MKAVFQEVEQHMQKGIDHLHHELKNLRTGRASVAILDNVMVDYFGNPTPLRQVANLSVADHHMLTAQPWDPKLIVAIEKAIRQSELNLNPSNDGKLIRIPIPVLNEDRRKEMVKRAHSMAEEARTAVRAARRDGNDKLKKMEKEKEIGEDQMRTGQDEVQKLHDRYIAEIAKSIENKEKDILEI